ncbi:MICOS complex subunit mic25a-like [Sycon ciliatum]|uniref:MICOS complex subunit mic25a-like n=1 Tax=Sycon ciliatum TaxID=27933 RepID=UPI0020A960DB|eukprot:scpid94495/ scgid16379/ 
MGGTESSPEVVEEVDNVITISPRAAEYLMQGGASGPDQRVAYLRKENNVLRNYIVSQQRELDQFEHDLNQAIETMNRQEKVESDARNVKESYDSKLAELEKEKESHRVAAQEAFDASSTQLRQRIRDLVPPSDSHPCEAQRSSVFNCLRSNAGQSLNCSEEASAFRECARQATQNAKN